MAKPFTRGFTRGALLGNAVGVFIGALLIQHRVPPIAIVLMGFISGVLVMAYLIASATPQTRESLDAWIDRFIAEEAADD